MYNKFSVYFIFVVITIPVVSLAADFNFPSEEIPEFIPVYTEVNRPDSDLKEIISIKKNLVISKPSLMDASDNPKKVQVFDLFSSEEKYSIAENQLFIASAQFSPDANEIVTVSKDFDHDVSIKTWNSENGALIHQLIIGDHPTYYINVFYSGDNKLLAVSNRIWTKIFDTGSGESLFELQERYVKKDCFSPDSKILITVMENFIELWDINSRQCIYRLNAYDLKTDSNFLFSFVDVSFSPYSMQIIVRYQAEPFGGAKWWYGVINAQNGDLLYGFDGDFGGNKIAFSPKGDLIAIGRSDKSVEIRDAKEGRLIKAINKHENLDDSTEIRSLCFNQNSSVIVIVDDEYTTVWDMANVAKITSFKYTVSRFRNAWFVDNHYVITNSKSNCIQLWKLPPVEIINSDNMLKFRIHSDLLKLYLTQCKDAAPSYQGYIDFIIKNYTKDENHKSDAYEVEDLLFSQLSESTQAYLRRLLPGRPEIDNEYSYLCISTNLKQVLYSMLSYLFT